MYCKTCSFINSSVRLQLKSLKMHVAQHILKNTLIDGHTEATCCFCGRNSCMSTLIQSSCRGYNKYFKIESNCMSKINTGKQVNKFSKRLKEQNVLISFYYVVCALLVYGSIISTCI